MKKKKTLYPVKSNSSLTCRRIYTNSSCLVRSCSESESDLGQCDLHYQLAFFRVISTEKN